MSMTRPPTWNEPMSRKLIGALVWANADAAARLSADTITNRRMAPSPSAAEDHVVAGHCRVRGRPRSLHQSSPGQPFLDDIGDLGIVLVLHQHVRVALDPEVREIDHVDGAAAGTHRVGIGEV